jgi:hypothetical protein
MVDKHITVDDRPGGTPDLGVQRYDRAQHGLTTASQLSYFTFADIRQAVPAERSVATPASPIRTY